jgi:hypothetical protein
MRSVVQVIFLTTVLGVVIAFIHRNSFALAQGEPSPTTAEGQGGDDTADDYER